MRYFAIIITNVFFVFFGYNNSYAEGDLAEHKLNGNVKSMQELSFEAVQKFGKIVKGNRFELGCDGFGSDFIVFNRRGYYVEKKSFTSDGVLCSEENYKYDSNDNKIEESFYSADETYQKNYKYDINNNEQERKSYIDGEPVDESTREYDDRGNCIEIKMYNYDGSPEHGLTFKYDTNHNKTEEIRYSSYEGIISKMKYKYDTRGNRIEEYEYDPYGDLLYGSTTEYDDKDKAIEMRMFGFNGELESKDLYKYDKNSNHIETKSYDSEGYLLGSYSIKYDDKHNEIEVISYDPDGIIKQATIYKYEYDKYDNWVKRTGIVDDIPSSITEREIEYYN